MITLVGLKFQRPDSSHHIHRFLDFPHAQNAVQAFLSSFATQ